MGALCSGMCDRNHESRQKKTNYSPSYWPGNSQTFDSTYGYIQGPLVAFGRKSKTPSDDDDDDDFVI